MKTRRKIERETKQTPEINGICEAERDNSFVKIKCSEIEKKTSLYVYLACKRTRKNTTAAAAAT